MYIHGNWGRDSVNANIVYHTYYVHLTPCMLNSKLAACSQPFLLICLNHFTVEEED